MSDPIQFRRTPWRTVILVCGKCSRKSDRGYGPNGKATLRTVLRDELKHRGHRREVRIVETKCFGLCPKKAVVAMNASLTGRLMTVPRGTDVDDALGHLLDAGAA